MIRNRALAIPSVSPRIFSRLKPNFLRIFRKAVFIRFVIMVTGCNSYEIQVLAELKVSLLRREIEFIVTPCQ
jgi:hypothetical protein